MMVREHNELLSIQFLLGAFKEGRPDHRTTEQPPPGSRQVSPTLLAKFGDRPLDHIDQKTLKDLDEPSYRAGLDQIHRDLVAKAASSYTCGYGNGCGFIIATPTKVIWCAKS